MKLKPEVKAAWVAALRSGEYKQGSARLASPASNPTRTWCCYGVLCKVMGLKEGEQFDVPGTFRPSAGLPATRFLQGLLLEGELIISQYSVRESAGIEDVVLTSLNDSGVPFATIADLIEEQL